MPVVLTDDFADCAHTALARGNQVPWRRVAQLPAECGALAGDNAASWLGGHAGRGADLSSEPCHQALDETCPPGYRSRNLPGCRGDHRALPVLPFSASFRSSNANRCGCVQDGVLAPWQYGLGRDNAHPDASRRPLVVSGLSDGKNLKSACRPLAACTARVDRRSTPTRCTRRPHNTKRLPFVIKGSFFVCCLTPGGASG